MFGDEFERLARFVRELQAQSEPLLGNVARAQEQLRSLTSGPAQQAIADWQASTKLAERFVQDQAGFASLVERASEQMRIFEREIVPAATRIRASIIKHAEVHLKAQEKLHATGWIGLEDHLIDEELDQVAEQPDEGLDAYVSGLFAENEHERLREMLDDWMDVPYLAIREPLLQQCLAAHVAGLWGVVIPTLLPLVDGLSAEIAQVPGILGDRKAGEVIKVSAVISAYRSDAVLETIADRWTTITIEFVQNQVYRCTKFGVDSPPPNPFNRHWILHGRLPEYWSEANSLRAFLLVYVLAQVARLANKDATGPAI